MNSKLFEWAPVSKTNFYLSPVSFVFRKFAGILSIGSKSLKSGQYDSRSFTTINFGVFSDLNHHHYYYYYYFFFQKLFWHQVTRIKPEVSPYRIHMAHKIIAHIILQKTIAFSFGNWAWKKAWKMHEFIITLQIKSRHFEIYHPSEENFIPSLPPVYRVCSFQIISLFMSRNGCFRVVFPYASWVAR